MNKSKILNVVLALLTVAALVFGIVTNGQKNSFKSQTEELTKQVEALNKDLTSAKTAAEEAAKSAEENLKAAEEAEALAEQAAADAETAIAEAEVQAEADMKSAVEKALTRAATAARNGQPILNPHVKSLIEVDGLQFIDLNDNGALDKYED